MIVLSSLYTARLQQEDTMHLECGGDMTLAKKKGLRSPAGIQVHARPKAHA